MKIAMTVWAAASLVATTAWAEDMCTGTDIDKMIQCNARIGEEKCLAQPQLSHCRAAWAEYQQQKVRAYNCGGTPDLLAVGILTECISLSTHGFILDSETVTQNGRYETWLRQNANRMTFVHVTNGRITSISTHN